ncbi:MAG: histidine kinase, partial [Brevundimonas sp.]|nr:histidine kinase [Brevundimonas sp.]
MRLPSLFRRTPFRLTLLFLALFAAVASAILAYVYVASASEAQAQARKAVEQENAALTAIFEERGPDALNQALVDRILTGGTFLHLYMERDGSKITGTLGVTARSEDGQTTAEPVNASPIPNYSGGEVWATFRFTDIDPDGRVVRKDAYGVQTTLSNGQMLFVGKDLGDTEAYLGRLTQALWMAMGMVLLLGAGGGLLISRNVERAMGRLNTV